MTVDTSLFSTKTRAVYDRICRRVFRIKYFLARVSESYGVPESDKMTYRDRVVELAGDLDSHFRTLAAKDLNQYNIEDEEKAERKYLKKVLKIIAKLEKGGRALLPSRVKLRRVTLTEDEIDETLLSSRIYDEPAMARDKLDYLNSIRAVLTGDTTKNPVAPEAKAAVELDKDLLQLKQKSFLERCAALDTLNPDILFKAKMKVENVANHGQVLAIDRDRFMDQQSLDRNYAYFAHLGGDNYGAFYSEDNISILLLVDLVDQQADPPAAAGRVSGWVEVGASRMDFAVSDPAATTAVDRGEWASRFLESLEMQHLYQSMKESCRELSEAKTKRRSHVSAQERERVSKALDGLL